MNNKNKNSNKQFILGKGLVKKTDFVKNQRFFQVQPYIQHHNSDKIDNIQIKDKNTKLSKGLNNNLQVNNKLFLKKLISGGGFVKLN